MPKKPQPRSAKAQRRRGQIIERGDKKWLVRVYIGSTGKKRRYSSVLVNGTFKTAEAKLTEMSRGLDTASYVAPSKQSLGVYLLQWIENKRDLEAKTKYDYKHWLEAHVVPALGHLKLGQLTKLHIQELYGSLSSDRKDKDGSPASALSPRTLQYIHAILRQALAAAVEDGMLVKNPSTGAQSSIPISTEGKAAQAMKALSFEEMNTVLTKATADRWYALWCFLLNTGLRPQEALALKWSDIEKREGITWITVNRALIQLEKSGEYEPRDFHTKREASRRQIAILDDTAQVLQKHRQVQLQVILKEGVKFTREDWIFATRTGRFLNPRNARTYWHRMLKNIGVPDRRLYDSRHTHLSHCLSSGMNPKAVSDRAGQSNPVTLLKVYAHVMKQDQIDGLNAIGRRIKEHAGNTSHLVVEAGVLALQKTGEG